MPEENINSWKKYTGNFFRVVASIWKLLAPFHGTFKVFVGIIIVYEALQIFEGYVLSGVIKMYTIDAPLKFWLALVICLVVYDTVFICLDNWLDTHVILKIINPVFRYLKLKSVQKFLDMELAWHQEKSSGTLAGKVNDGVWKIHAIIDGWCWEFFPTMIQASLSLIPILYFSPWVAIVAGLAFVVFMAITIAAYNERGPLRKLRHDLYEKDWQQSDEMIRSVETSLMFNQRERLMNEYRGLHTEIFDCAVAETYLGIYKYNRWRIRALSFARRLILVIWVCQLQAGTLGIAELVFVNVLVEKLFHSFWRFGKLFDRTAEASEAAKRLENLIAETPKMLDTENPLKAHGSFSIVFDEVDFRYPKSDNGRAIDHLSFKVDPGEIVALVGRSGGGKTTIRKVLMRLFDVDRGRVEVGGIDVKYWPQEELRQLFACVPQGDDVYIFDDTIARNIMFPNIDVDRKMLYRATKLAGLFDFVEGLSKPKEPYYTFWRLAIKSQPGFYAQFAAWKAFENEGITDGFEVEVGERGVKLSGGQKQRVALARAILADRPILILDEATSAVDAITEQEIQTSLRDVLKDRTTIIIAHRLSTIRFADKIIVLDHGTKIEEGTHEELVSLGGCYAEMVKIQSH